MKGVSLPKPLPSLIEDGAHCTLHALLELNRGGTVLSISPIFYLESKIYYSLCRLGKSRYLKKPISCTPCTGNAMRET